MIRALVSGRLHDAPQARTSQSGNPFTTGKLRADGKDGATVWTSIIAFGELGERLATLPAGAALSVSGRAEVNAWLDKNGEPRAGLSVVVEELATLRGKPRLPSESRPPSRRPARQPEPAGIPFDDLDDWQP